MINFWTKNIDDIFKEMDTGVEGLTSDNAVSRMNKFGKNEYTKPHKDSLVKKIIHQFKDISMIILLIAKVIDLLYDGCSDCKKFIKDKQYIENLNSSISNGKYRIKPDCDYGDLLQVKNGCRRTCYTPKNNSQCQKIYMCGPCIAEGLFTCDKCTIESSVQSLINNKNLKYEVINYGNGGGRDWINDLERILDTPLHPGEIVIHLNTTNSVLNKVFQQRKMTAYETSSLFNRPHNHGSWMIDDGLHVNCTGNKVIANYIFETIEPNLASKKPVGKAVKYKFENEVDTFLDENPEFKSYLDDLKKIRDEKNIKGTIGSIVMNCNPFTLGHRYPIEEACKKVDHLYIFVVEEDKSVFPFKDRMELVKKGVSDLGDKVTVLPSGEWMISLLTFPEYFSKDSLQEAAIDPSKDVTLFGKYICPSLNISQRFAGEEPTDSVTRQYNNSMKSILPNYGIKFTEIPRNSYDTKNIISATEVRNIIRNGSSNLSDEQIADLKQYVPDSTLNYLKQNCELLVSKLKK